LPGFGKACGRLLECAAAEGVKQITGCGATKDLKEV